MFAYKMHLAPGTRKQRRTLDLRLLDYVFVMFTLAAETETKKVTWRISSVDLQMNDSTVEPPGCQLI